MTGIRRRARRRARRIRRMVFATAAASVALGAGVAAGQPGDADLGFGRGGEATVDSGRSDQAVAVAVEPDGRIVVGGHASRGTTEDPAAYVLNRDGSPDRAFGTDGVKTVPTFESDRTEAMALQPDGRILLAGTTALGTGNGEIIRLNAAGGTLDPTFGTGGVVSDLDSGGSEVLYAVAADPRGRIVAAGTSSVSTQAVVYRRTAGGAPDTGFDQDGARGIDLGGTEGALAVAVQPDGAILVAGLTSAAGGSAFVARFTDAGEPDDGFGGGDGVALVGGLSAARAIALQPDGRIVLGGDADLDIGVARLTASGEPDTSFGKGTGSVRFDTGGQDSGTALALQPDGRILVAGYAYPADFRALVYRLRDDGSRDATFGNDGLVATGAGGRQEGDWALALQPDGRIVLAGTTEDTKDIRVIRLDGDRPVAAGGGAGAGAGPGPVTGGRPAVVRCAGRRATIVGTRRADRITGTRRADVIAGLGGDDVIRGLGGNDLICGGAGRDRLIGGAGRDRLVGGAGRDLVRQ